jgi:hypothetical protein
MTPRLHNNDFLHPATRDALHSLDPANVDPQVAASPRAQATLARILASDTPEPTTTLPVNTGWARRPRRRWVVAGAALVAVGVLIAAPAMLSDRNHVVAPSVLKGKAAVVVPRALGGNTEFVSWSPTTKVITPAEAALAGKRCKADQLHYINTAAARKVVGSSQIRLVDHRGAWTMVYLGGGVQPGYEVICLNEYDSHGAILNGGGTAQSGGPGLSPVASNTVAPITGVGFSTQSGATWCVAGQVGSDVVSVVINTIEHGPVEATIQNGYFGAWWPGPSLPILMPVPKKGEPAPPAPTYTLTLKDGTIRANIPQEQLQPKFR